MSLSCHGDKGQGHDSEQAVRDTLAVMIEELQYMDHCGINTWTKSLWRGWSSMIPWGREMMVCVSVSVCVCGCVCVCARRGFLAIYLPGDYIRLGVSKHCSGERLCVSVCQCVSVCVSVWFDSGSHFHAEPLSTDWGLIQQRGVGSRRGEPSSCELFVLTTTEVFTPYTQWVSVMSLTPRQTP